MLLQLFKCNSYFEFIDKACRKLFPSKIFKLGKAYLLSCQTNKLIPTRQLKNVLIRKASEVDLSIIVACESERNGETLFRAYFETGRQCYVAIFENRCIAYAWAFYKNTTITFDNYQQSNILTILPQNSCFIGDGFIHPEWRMKGLFPLLIAYIFDDLSQKHSITTVYNHIYYSSEHSMRSSTRLGFTLQKTIIYVRLLNIQWIVIYSKDGNQKMQKLTSETELVL